jgi:hypothetical protein
MATVQWRPEVNALTSPVSYKMLYVPRAVVGYDELAAEISATHPHYSEEMIRSISMLLMERIQLHLINGNQVTLENAFTYRLSFSCKLDSPDSPLPDRDDLINVKVFASPNCVKEVRHAVQLERTALIEKLPVIASAEDTKLKLPDVLYGGGVLRLTGSNLYFNEENTNCSCVITGTRSTETKQETFASISNSSIMLVPDIRTQAHQWNNEYIVSVNTQYSVRGSLRTGTYRRKLRSPVMIPLPVSGQFQGILTGNADIPYVSIIAGTASAAEMLRIQAVVDLHNNSLQINLLDMKEGGSAGVAIPITSEDEYTLEGFAGSAVQSLQIGVENLAALITLIKNSYSGRLVDILDVRV